MRLRMHVRSKTSLIDRGQLVERPTTRAILNVAPIWILRRATMACQLATTSSVKGTEALAPVHTASASMKQLPWLWVPSLPTLNTTRISTIPQGLPSHKKRAVCGQRRQGRVLDESYKHERSHRKETYGLVLLKLPFPWPIPLLKHPIWNFLSQRNTRAFNVRHIGLMIREP
jgi:hypothetical protein